MEADKEDDPFASIIKFCKPTASQEAKFPNCPLARESENFVDTYPDQFSSSPDPTPLNPTGIVMVSPPGSSSSVHQQVDDEAVFHTPPEHHAHSHLSSSEDQNVNDLCAEGVGAVDGADSADRRKQVRVFEGGLNDEPEAKKFRVMEEKLDGETVPLGETEAIETEGNQVVHGSEVVIIDSDDSGEELATVNLGDDSLDVTSRGCKIDVVQKNDELVKDGEPKVDAVEGNHELRKRCSSLGDNRVNKGEKCNENSDLSGSLDSGKIESEIVELKCIVGNRCIEVEQKGGAVGPKKGAKIIKDAKMPKDWDRNRGLETDGKRIQEVGVKTDDEKIEIFGRETVGKRTEEIRFKTDNKSIVVIDRETDGNRPEEIGQTDGKRTEEIGLESDRKKFEESGQTDGKRINEIGLENNGKKFEESGQTDGERINEIGLENNGKKFENFGQTDGKRINEIGLETDGKRIEEIGLETDGKRIQEIALEINGKKIEEIGLITDGKRSGDIGQKTNGKRIEDIDEFRYTGGDDRQWKGRTGRADGDSGRKRQLPVSFKGKEKEMETEHGLLDFLDVLKAVFGYTDGDCDDVDFLATAKRRGLTFPKPRWWGDDERWAS